jgi:hypothetical protein
VGRQAEFSGHTLAILIGLNSASTLKARSSRNPLKMWGLPHRVTGRAALGLPLSRPGAAGGSALKAGRAHVPGSLVGGSDLAGVALQSQDVGRFFAAFRNGLLAHA